MHEGERARQYARLAYERRAHADERERLSITYQYHFEVTGDQVQATAALEDWKRAFPSEHQPVNSLTVIHNFLGRFERAVEEGLEAVRRNPAHGFPYSNLSHAYRGLGRWSEARRTAEQAVALNVETLPTRRLLYQLAVIDGDVEGAQRHLDWAKDRPREFDMIGAHAQVLGWAGRVREARDLYEEAARQAERRNLADVGTNHLAWATWMELAYGNQARAGQEARRILARNPSYDSLMRAALSLAVAGAVDQAGGTAHGLVYSNPQHTMITSVFAPIVRAAIALTCHRPARAIEELQIVAPYELGFIAALAPLYLRAQSLLALGNSRDAADEFQRLLDHRGSDPFSPFHPAATVGLARAQALAGNAEASARTYERFLTGWADADADVPLLCQARQEYGLLGSRPPVSRGRPKYD